MFKRDHKVIRISDKKGAKLRDPAVNPMEVKKQVAANLARQYHGAEAAERAAEHFRTVVQEKSVPDDIVEVRIPSGVAAGPVSWPDLLVASGVATSKSEVRRLMQQGGFYVEQAAVTDPALLFTPEKPVLIRLGKRRYYRLVPS